MKSAVITGCSSGLGYHLAIELLKQDFRVYGTSRELESLDKLIKLGLVPLYLDLADKNSIENFISEVDDVDILINNAGYAQVGPMIQLDQEIVKKQFEVNFFSHLHIINSFIPKMVEKESPVIVNIGSMSGVMATPLAGSYSSSKAAFNMYTDVLRMELSSLGIRVVKVLPGIFKSSFGINAEKEIKSNKSKFYKDIESQLTVRAHASQNYSSSPENVAKKIVRKILKRKPPGTIIVGRGGFTARFVSYYVPSFIKDYVFKKKFKV